MNVLQKTVLILGVVALLFVLYSTESYQHVVNGIIRPANTISGFANVWDWQSALVRSVIVAAITAGLYFVVGRRAQ